MRYKFASCMGVFEHELLALEEIDSKYRQVCGLYAQEKMRADKLAARVEELEKRLEGSGC